MKDPREDKLPRWAQDMLRDERMRADKAEERLAAVEGRTGPSRIWYGDYRHPIYIPEPNGYQTVHFQHHGEDSHNDIQVRIHKPSGKLQINGGRTLHVEMEVSNSFFVVLEPQ